MERTMNSALIIAMCRGKTMCANHDHDVRIGITVGNLDGWMAIGNERKTATSETHDEWANFRFSTKHERLTQFLTYN